MNLKQLQEKLKNLLAQATDFKAKAEGGELDDKARDEFKTVLEEAEKIKGQIEELTTMSKSAADLIEAAADPAPGMPKLTPTATKTVSTDAKGKHGEDVFTLDASGIMRLLYTDDPLYQSEKLEKLASDDYRKAFRIYLKSKGDLGSMDRDSYKTLQVGIDEDGGFLAPPQMINRIIAQKPGTDSVTALVTNQPTQSAAVTMLREEDTGEDVYGTDMRPQSSAEGRDATEIDQDKLVPFKIDVHEDYTSVPISRTFLEDAPEAVEQYIARKFRNAYDLKMEDRIINGTGINQPFGILTRAGTTYGPDVRNVGDPLVPAEIIEAFYELPEQYARNSTIVMRRSAYGQLASIADGSGQFIFGRINNYDGMAVRPQEAMFGVPIKFSDLMPAKAANANWAIYGDFKEAYMLVMRMGLTVRFRDIADEGKVKIVFRSRYGGDVMFGRGLKIWKETDV